jgi:hypothetical protein
MAGELGFGRARGEEKQREREGKREQAREGKRGARHGLIHSQGRAAVACVMAPDRVTGRASTELLLCLEVGDEAVGVGWAELGRRGEEGERFGWLSAQIG